MELNPVFSLELRRCWFQHVEHYLFSRFLHNMCLFHSTQTRQIISCFYFFYLLLFLFSLELKETLALLATGLPWEWKQVYSLTVFLRSVFSLLVLTHSCVYTQLFGSIFGFTRYTDSCLHSFASVLASSLSLSLFSVSISFISGSWSLYFSPCFLTAAPPFFLIFIMPLSNSPVAVLVCVQVSHPTDQWGRCRCKWISSLTLALESTKSAWRVSFFLYSNLLFVISSQICSHLQIFTKIYLICATGLQGPSAAQLLGAPSKSENKLITFWYVVSYCN